jgi:hypothetical protein
MPDNRLEGLRLRGNRVGINRRNDDTRISHSRRITAVASENAKYFRADPFCKLYCADDIGTDLAPEKRIPC